MNTEENLIEIYETFSENIGKLGSDFEAVLDGLPEYELQEFYKKIEILGIDSSDPVWVLLAFLNHHEYMAYTHSEIMTELYKNHKDDLENVFKQVLRLQNTQIKKRAEEQDKMTKDHLKKFEIITESFFEGLESRSQQVAQIQTLGISREAHKLVNQIAIKKAATNISALVVAFLVVGSVSLSFGLGGYRLAIAQQQAIKYSPELPKRLTLDEANYLEKLKDPGFKLLLKIIEYNRDSLIYENGEFVCERDAKESGMIVKINGRKVKNGWCNLFIRDVKDRKYVK